ncbi:MAG TPA: DUF2516 family protein [Acidimicrobiales bacterium]
MTGEIFGVQGLLILAVMLVSLGVGIWAIADAISRPAGAFAAAGSSKGLWIALIVLAWIFTGPLGLILAIVYLASIRPRVKALTA